MVTVCQGTMATDRRMQHVGNSANEQSAESGLNRVLIAVATYKRPDGLQALLQSLERATHARPFDVLVVDNDANGTGRSVAEASRLNVVYVIEPKPGIAAARNRAVDMIADYDAVVFVDDDEYVVEGWLDHLVEYAESSAAGVITGPVESVFPDNAPRWVVNGGFIQRPSWPHGTVLSAGATNNTLLKIAAWKAAGAPRFDDTFSATGGSDAKLFSVLLARGVRIEFCATAGVFEPVLPERMRFKWLARRGYRNGIVSARIWELKHGRAKTLVKGVVLALGGLVKALRDLVLGRGLQARSFNGFLNGLGVVSALIGVRVHEYKRKPDPKSVRA
jgi:succinoglycan biosynthesis protein ExoM